MKRTIACLALALVVSACYAQSEPTNEDAGSTHVRHCGTWNAQYAVTFKKLSGDCPNIDDRVSYQWIDQDGIPVVPADCTNRSIIDACTTYVNEDCRGWVYEQQLSGELDWYTTTAHGYLTFTAYELQNHYLFCSSVYETTYTLQWVAADNDGGE